MPENSFEMQSVTSSQIESVGFNEATNQIKIRFLKNGAEYLYEGCTEDEFNELVNAASVGQQFAASIKGIKSFRRIA